jgi:hypothetical protein
MQETGKWESRSFSVHSKDDKDLIAILDEAARRKQLSDLVRKALRSYIEERAKARRIDLNPVLERLDRIERKLDQGAAVATGPGIEDDELARDLDSLLE